MITMASESAKRIVEVLSEESTIKNPEHPVYEVRDGSIDFDKVNFKYSKNAEKMALAISICISNPVRQSVSLEEPGLRNLL